MFFFPFKPRRKSWVETPVSLTQVPVNKCLSHIWRVEREKVAAVLLLLGLHETVSQQRKDFRSSSSLGQAQISFWWTGDYEETGEKVSRSLQWWLEWEHPRTGFSGLNPWSPVGRTVWEALRSVALSGEGCHWEKVFEVSIDARDFSFSALCLCIKLWALGLPFTLPSWTLWNHHQIKCFLL